jgi:predicted ArsR family transcriptional regulator
MTEDERSIWEALVPVALAETRVAILEALEWIGRPLSATDLSKAFGDPAIACSHTYYHLTALAKAGVVEVKRSRKVRGSTEWFYGLTSSSVSGTPAGSRSR